MVQCGYFLLFGDNMVGTFEDKKLECLVATVQISGSKCYPLLMENVNPASRKVTVQDVWSWHKRIGHLNFKSMQMLKHKEMVIRIPKLIEHNGVYESYATGK